MDKYRLQDIDEEELIRMGILQKNPENIEKPKPVVNKKVKKNPQRSKQKAKKETHPEDEILSEELLEKKPAPKTEPPIPKAEDFVPKAKPEPEKNPVSKTDPEPEEKSVSKADLQLEKTETEIKWKPKYDFDHISDEVLEKAEAILEQDLIDKIVFTENDKGEPRVKITYFFFTCKHGTYNQKIDRIDNARSMTRKPDKPIETCSNASCGEMRCIPVVAAYIKYTKELGIYDKLMQQRAEYQEHLKDDNLDLQFEWEPKDIEKFKHLPAYAYELAEQMIEKGCVMLRPYMNNKEQFNVDIKKLGHCSTKDDKGVIKGDIYAGPHDIKRALIAMKEPEWDVPHGWCASKKFSLCDDISNLCNCDTPFCPYHIAAYMLYLRLKGREDEIEEAKKYSKEHPDEIYYGKNNFGFKYTSEKDVEKLKQSIASAPKNILDAAFELLDSGEAFLNSKKYTAKNGSEYFRVQFSRSPKDGETAEECMSSEYTDSSAWHGPGGILDYEGISVRDRLVRLVACIDYCRRTGIDISDAVSRREIDFQKLKEMTDKIDGLGRLYSFIENDNTSSMFCIMQGSVGSGKQPVIESIADILSQNGKISTSKYKKMTLQQLTEDLTTHRSRKGEFDLLTTGYEFSWLEKNQLYVLTGLDEFLYLNRTYRQEKGYMTHGIALRHVTKVLGTFAENTYVIIVSLSDKSTKEFLDLDKKYKYTYGQNIILFKNKSTDELYQEYLEEISDTVKEKIEDEKALRTRFAEFITLNERFLPFTNSALSHYLAEYSNVENAPVLPPDVYDRKAVAQSLDDMIGMQAVKKQLAEFESYITFQKRAKASGIEIKPGNLHMQFLGNPGTGKTTIARIVAKMLFDIGIIEENKVIEVERKDLVAEYTGQSAPKTAEKIRQAMGGVLFIDEAYSLCLSEHDQFGKEVISTLIKAMEDDGDKFIVIFAGYDKEMKEFLKANSGIESRIGYTFHFEDYTADELTEIFRRSLEKQGFELGKDVLKEVSDICDYYRRRKNFGNGRFAKKLEQRTIINHAKNADEKNWEIKKISTCDIPEIKDLGTQSSGGEGSDITLDQIIGMSKVKDQIKKFRTKIRFEQKAKAAGANIKKSNSHMLLLGNPGTGKTTIARIIAKELYEAGLILENKLIEVEKKDLIGQYIGQTAPKTSAVIDQAMGGVLFIDEAYSLTSGSRGINSDYGQEAIATIIKAMEDHKDEFVVMFAGYEREMRQFLDSNSGIASRIGYTFTFDDYTADELTDIFKLKLEKNGLAYTDEALDSVKDVMQYFVSVPNFGNGRFAERVVNIAIELHSERMAEQGGITDDLLTITKEDIPSVKYMLDHMPDGKNMINPENIKDEQNERTAIHELGHALIVKLKTPESSIERITISAEGSGALGYVRHSVDSIRNHTKTDLKNQICINMAGIAAEEIFLGEYGNGGTSDLSTATNIATNMVTRFGMSDNGFASFSEINDQARKEINDILKSQFDEAKKYITEYKDKLEEAKQFLLTNRTITDKEFTEFIQPDEKEIK